MIPQNAKPKSHGEAQAANVKAAIGHAVPRRLARAIVAAAIQQDSDVRFLETIDAAKAA